MESNPYTPRLAAATTALSEAKECLQEQVEHQGWLFSFNEKATRAAQAEAMKAVTDIEIEIAKVERSISSASFEIRDHLTTFQRIIFAASNAFSSDTSPASAVNVEDLHKLKAALEVKLEAQRTLVTDLRYQLQLYSTGGWVESDTEVADLTRLINWLAPQIEKLEVKERQFAEHLAEPLTTLGQLRAALIIAQDLANEADRFALRFHEAHTDSKAQTKIRLQCEALFGVDHPDRAARLKSAHVEQIQRDIAKCEKRIADLHKRDSRAINRLVLDGNNLCNRGTGKSREFIGLSALMALVPAIEKAHPGVEVIVVFDPGILRMLKLGWDEVAEQFPPHVQLYAVPRGREADETFIELADDETAYIVTNDRLVEFQNRPAVKGGRVFGHDITRSNVLVHDLWVRATYSADQDGSVQNASGSPQANGA